MKAPIVLALLLLIFVPAASVATSPLPTPANVEARVANQRVDLTWDEHPGALGYQVLVFRDAQLLQLVNTTAATFTFAGTNGVPYVFQVAIRLDESTQGPFSHPIGATPTLPRDLQYLAVGLIVTWGSLFAYAAGLAHREQKLEKQLDRILQQQLRGNQP